MWIKSANGSKNEQFPRYKGLKIGKIVTYLLRSSHYLSTNPVQKQGSCPPLIWDLAETLGDSAIASAK